MNRTRSLARSSGHNFLAQLVVAAAGLAVSVAVARTLGPSRAGSYNLLLFLALMAATLATAGLPTSLTTWTAAHRTRGQAQAGAAGRRWATRISVGLALLVVAGVGVATAAGARLPGVGPGAALLAAGSVPFACYAALATAALQGMGRFDLIRRVSVRAAPLGVALVVLALVTHAGLAGLMAANLAAAAATAILVGRQVGRRDPGSSRLAGSQRRAFVAAAVPTSVVVVLDVIVWERSEVLFLSATTSARQVAYYALAFTMVSRVMALVPGSVSGVLLTRFAQDHVTSDLPETFTAASRYLTLLTAPLMAVGTVFAGPLVLVVFGASYAGMRTVVEILAVSAGLAAIITAGSSALYGSGQQRWLARLAVVITLLDLGLDLVIIPRAGAIGAAVANAAAQGVGISCGLWYLTRRRRLRFPWRAAAGTLLTAFGLAAATRLVLSHLGAGSLTTAALGAAGTLALYGCAAPFTGCLTQSELAALGLARLAPHRPKWMGASRTES